MKKIIFERPNALFDALEQGKKLMIFEVDDAQKPISPLSSVKVEKNEILPKNRDIIQPALRYVNEHFDKEIRLDALAKMCDLSKSYFCRVFKETCGTSVTDYVISLRMREACRLLATTDESVVSIAVEVGYVDCGYFNKLFKKNVGCTPLSFSHIKHSPPYFFCL